MKMETQGVTIREHFEKTGNWLFQRRSYLPIVCFSIIIISLRHFHFPYGKHTVFLIILLFFAMEEAASLLTTGSFEPDTMWLIILAAGSAQYMLFRFLKKHTKLLRNPS